MWGAHGEQDPTDAIIHRIDIAMECIVGDSRINGGEAMQQDNISYGGISEQQGTVFFQMNTVLFGHDRSKKT